MTPGFVIDPPSIFLPPGVRQRFRALDAATGVELTVQWELMPGSGSVSPDGWVIVCPSRFPYTIRATLVADPTRRQTAQVETLYFGPTGPSIDRLVVAGTSDPAPLDSLIGDIAVIVPLTAKALVCTPTLGARLELRDASGRTAVLGEVRFAEPPELYEHAFIWKTATVGDGDYVLRAFLTVQGLGEVPTQQIPVKVHNQ